MSRHVASAFAVMGLAALAITLWRTGWISPKQSTVPQSSVPPGASYEGPVPEYSTLLDEDTVEMAVRDAFTALETSQRGNIVLTGIERDKISSVLDAAEQDLTMFLSGSWEAYREMLTSSGARNPLLERAADKDEAWESLRSFWNSTVEPIRLRPIDPNGLKVRVRYRDGRDFGPYPEDALIVGVASAAHQFPGVSVDPLVNRLTVVEAIIPVMYIYDGKMQHAWFGIWYALDSSASKWRITRTHVATLERPSNVGIVPTI